MDINDNQNTVLQVPVDSGNPAGQVVTDTNNGFLVGVDDPSNTVADIAAIQQATNPPQTDTQSGYQGRLFTEEEVGRIRQEEKDKLYSRIEDLERFRQQAEAEAAERERQVQERLAAEEAARKAAEEAEMTQAELALRRQEEMQASIEELRRDIERKDALLEQESRLRQLDHFRSEVLEREKEFIIPELRDLVTGNTEEEILASIEMAKQKTSAIVSSMQEAALVQRQHTPGVSSAGAPPVGPMEQAPSYETFTPDQIRNMDMATYTKNRARLLRASSPGYRG